MAAQSDTKHVSCFLHRALMSNNATALLSVLSSMIENAVSSDAALDRVLSIGFVLQTHLELCQRVDADLHNQIHTHKLHGIHGSQLLSSMLFDSCLIMFILTRFLEPSGRNTTREDLQYLLQVSLVNRDESCVHDMGIVPQQARKVLAPGVMGTLIAGLCKILTPDARRGLVGDILSLETRESESAEVCRICWIDAIKTQCALQNLPLSDAAAPWYAHACTYQEWMEAIAALSRRGCKSCKVIRDVENFRNQTELFKRQNNTRITGNASVCSPSALWTRHEVCGTVQTAMGVGSVRDLRAVCATVNSVMLIDRALRTDGKATAYTSQAASLIMFDPRCPLNFSHVAHLLLAAINSSDEADNLTTVQALCSLLLLAADSGTGIRRHLSELLLTHLSDLLSRRLKAGIAKGALRLLLRCLMRLPRTECPSGCRAMASLRAAFAEISDLPDDISQLAVDTITWHKCGAEPGTEACPWMLNAQQQLVRHDRTSIHPYASMLRLARARSLDNEPFPSAAVKTMFDHITDMLTDIKDRHFHHEVHELAYNIVSFIISLAGRCSRSSSDVTRSAVSAAQKCILMVSSLGPAVIPLCNKVVMLEAIGCIITMQTNVLPAHHSNRAVTSLLHGTRALLAREEVTIQELPARSGTTSAISGGKRRWSQAVGPVRNATVLRWGKEDRDRRGYEDLDDFIVE